VEDKDVNEGDKYYMAQELLNGQVGKHSDIFSLGVTLYEMVTNQVGELPGEGEPWHHLRDGKIDLEEYMVGSSTQTSVPACSPSDSPKADQTTASTGLVRSASLSEIISVQPQDLISSINSKVSGHRKLFSADLLWIIREMLQPTFEQRPTAASTLKCPAVQRILKRRSEQGSKGLRSEEAMGGLLLQSV